MEFGNQLKKEKIKLNQMESKSIFKNIKSKYILQLLFNNLEKYKTLNVIKYNKIIKKRVNINISDYKEYSEEYSSIEIELKPVNNKYGTFINIKDEDKKYYR